MTPSEGRKENIKIHIKYISDKNKNEIYRRFFLYYLCSIALQCVGLDGLYAAVTAKCIKASKGKIPQEDNVFSVPEVCFFLHTYCISYIYIL